MLRGLLCLLLCSCCPSAHAQQPESDPSAASADAQGARADGGDAPARPPQPRVELLDAEGERQEITLVTYGPTLDARLRLVERSGQGERATVLALANSLQSDEGRYVDLNVLDATVTVDSGGFGAIRLEGVVPEPGTFRGLLALSVRWGTREERFFYPLTVRRELPNRDLVLDLRAPAPLDTLGFRALDVAAKITETDGRAAEYYPLRLDRLTKLVGGVEIDQGLPAMQLLRPADRASTACPQGEEAPPLLASGEPTEAETRGVLEDGVEAVRETAPRLCLQAGGADEYRLRIDPDDLSGPGKYTATVEVRTPDGTARTDAVTFYLRHGWLLCALAIGLGTAGSVFLRSWVGTGRSRARRKLRLRRFQESIRAAGFPPGDPFVAQLEQAVLRLAEDDDLDMVEEDVDAVVEELARELDDYGVVRRILDLGSRLEQTSLDPARLRDLQRSRERLQAELARGREVLKRGADGQDSELLQECRAWQQELVGALREALRGRLQRLRDRADALVDETLPVAELQSLQALRQEADALGQSVESAVALARLTELHDRSRELSARLLELEARWALRDLDGLAERAGLEAQRHPKLAPRWRALQTRIGTVRSDASAGSGTERDRALKRQRRELLEEGRCLDGASTLLAEIEALQQRLDPARVEGAEADLAALRAQLQQAAADLLRDPLDPEVQRAVHGSHAEVAGRWEALTGERRALPAPVESAFEVRRVPDRPEAPGVPLPAAEPIEEGVAATALLSEILRATTGPVLPRVGAIRTRVRLTDFVVQAIAATASVLFGVMVLWSNDPGWGGIVDYINAALWGFGIHELNRVALPGDGAGSAVGTRVKELVGNLRRSPS